MFPRARLRRFNEASEHTPGVGSYNITEAGILGSEKNRCLKKLNQSTAQLKDKAFVANVRGELPKHVEDLHQRLRASEEKVIDLDILKISAEKEREMLQKEVGKLQIQIGSLQRDCETNLAAKETSEQTSCRLKEEKAQLLEKNAELIKTQHKQVAELQALNGELQGQVVHFKEMCEHRDRLIQELESKASEMKQKLDTLDAEKLSLRHELERALQEANEKSKSERAAFLIEINALKESNAQFEKVCKDTHDERLKLLETSHADKLHDCEQRIEFLNSERAMLENKIAEVIEQHQAELSHLEQKESALLSAKQSEFMLTSLAYEEIKLQKVALENNLYALQTEKKELEKQIKRSSDEMSSLNGQHVKQVKELTEELAHQKKQFSSVISEMYAKTLAYEELKSLKASLESEQHRMNDLVHSAQAEVSTLREQHKEEMNELAEMFKSKQKEMDELSAQRAFLEKDISTIEANSILLQSENKELREKIDRANADVCALKQQHEKEVNRLTELTNFKQEEIDKLSSQKLALEEVVSKQEINICSTETYNKNLREEIDSALLEISALRQQREEDLNRLTEIIDSKQKELDESISKKELLEKDLSTLEINFSSVQAENKELQEDINCTKLEISAIKRQREEELNRLMEVSNVKQRELNNLSSQKTTLEKDVSSLEITLNSIQLENNEHKEEIKSAQLEISTLRQQHEENLNRLTEITNLKQEELDELSSQKATLENHVSTLEINISSIQDENKQFREEVNRTEAFMAALQKEHEEKVRKLEKEKDYQENQYREMMNEMSEKIQQLEEDGANVSADSQGEEENCWKERYEELQQKMEPFKEIIDAYEVERKLIEDRDKYTQEQIDKLQQEAIKNMGHQNHKQKVKYVNSIKQENITLHQKYQESQEELFRQTALVKKYKQKIDLLEGGGKAGIGKTDVKPRPKVPLKEGNR